MENPFAELTVVKRTGQRVNFNSLKIAVAIKAAFDSISNSYKEADINKVFQDTLKNIADGYVGRKTINVEDIQDIIEKTLLNDKYEDVYKSFSLYRIRRAESRKAFSEKQQHKFVKAIEKIGDLKNKDKDEITTFQLFQETIFEEYNKSYLLDHKFVRAHEEGKVFIHHLPYFNLGYINETNLLINSSLDEDHDFLDLFAMITNASKETSGEIGINNFDIILDSYFLNRYKILLKDNIIDYLDINGFLSLINVKKLKEVINHIVSLDDNFTNNLEFKDNLILINAINKIKNKVIESLKEIMQDNLNSLFINLEKETNYCHFAIGDGSINIQKSLLDTLNKVFPLKHVSIIYKIKDNAPKEILEHLAQLILNKQNILITTYDTSFSNGLIIKENKENIAQVSINLSRLWFKYKEISNDFLDELDSTLDLARNILNFIFETIGDKPKENYKYLFNGNITDDEKLDEGQVIRKVIKGGTLDFNLIGLKELDSRVNEVLKHIRKRIDGYKKDSIYNYTLSAINDLSASTYMMELDKTIFGDKISKNEYYQEISASNSSNYEDLANLTNYLDGGFINNFTIKNITMKSILNIIEKVMDYHLGITRIRGIT